MKKILIALGIIILLAVVVILSLPSILNMVAGSDSELKDASDLTLRSRVIDPKANAFTILDDMEQDSPWESEAGSLVNLSDPEKMASWNQQAATELIDANEEYYKVGSAALALDKYQNPSTADQSSPSFFGDEYSMASSQARKIGNLLTLRAIHHYKEKRIDKAVDDLVSTYKLGSMLTEGNPDAIELLVGLALKKKSLLTFEKLSANSGLPENQQKFYKKKVKEFEARGNRLDQAFLGEYKMAMHGVDSIQTGDMEEFGGTEEMASEWAEVKTLNTNSYFFKPNETKNLLSDKTRQYQQDAKQPCSYAVVSPPSENRLLSMVSPNSVGKLYVQVITSGLDPMFTRTCEVEKLYNKLIE